MGSNPATPTTQTTENKELPRLYPEPGRDGKGDKNPSKSHEENQKSHGKSHGKSGHAQGKVADALAAEPSRRFTHRELAEAVFSGELIEGKHLVAVCRALKKIPHFHCRVGKPGRANGWFHKVSATP